MKSTKQKALISQLEKSNRTLTELYESFEDGKMMRFVMPPLKKLIDKNNELIKQAKL